MMETIQNNDSHNVNAIFGEDDSGDSTSVIEALGQIQLTSRLRVCKMVAVVKRVIQQIRRWRGYTFYVSHMYVSSGRYDSSREWHSVPTGSITIEGPSGQEITVSRNAVREFVAQTADNILMYESKRYIKIVLENSGYTVEDFKEHLDNSIDHARRVSGYIFHVSTDMTHIDALCEMANVSPVFRSCSLHNCHMCAGRLFKNLYHMPRNVVDQVIMLLQQVKMWSTNVNTSIFDGGMIRANYLFAIEIIDETIQLYDHYDLSSSVMRYLLKNLKVRVKRWRKTTKRYIRWLLYFEHMANRLRRLHDTLTLRISDEQILVNMVYTGSSKLIKLAAKADEKIWQELCTDYIPYHVACPDVAKIIMSYVGDPFLEYITHESNYTLSDSTVGLRNRWKYEYEIENCTFSFTRSNNIDLCAIGRTPLGSLPNMQRRHDSWTVRLCEPWIYEMPMVNDSWGECGCMACNASMTC
jgi:hypothetical protein